MFIFWFQKRVEDLFLHSPFVLGKMEINTKTQRKTLCLCCFCVSSTNSAEGVALSELIRRTHFNLNSSLFTLNSSLEVELAKLHRAQGCKKLGVLCLCADGDAEAVLTEGDACAVADDNTLLYEIVVCLLCIFHLCEEEVGISRVDMLADR